MLAVARTRASTGNLFSPSFIYRGGTQSGVMACLRCLEQRQGGNDSCRSFHWIETKSEVTVCPAALHAFRVATNIEASGRPEHLRAT